MPVLTSAQRQQRDYTMKSTTRREFITRAGAAAVGLTLGGAAAAVRADETAKIVVGTGEHTYECVHDWLMPPEDIKWGDTHGIAEDRAGNIYIAHTVHPSSPKPDAVVVFNRDGKFVTSWGERFKGGAHGLDLRREGRDEFLYHCDTAKRQVVKTDLSGKVQWEMGVPEEAGVYRDGAPYIPTNVAFAPDGDFYVADGYGSSWIHQYDIQGNYIRTFGGKGSDPGKVIQPHGLWVDRRGKEPFLVVADRGNNRLQYFTLDGKHLRFVTEGMRRPCHLNPRGDWMLIPDLNSVITILDRDNKVAAHLGDGGNPSKLRGAPREQFIPGQFVHPHDAQFLRNGNILVAEWVPIGRITLLRKATA